MTNIIFGEITELPLPIEIPPKVQLSQEGIKADSLFSLYVLTTALEKIERHLKENPKIESGGLLLGHAFIDKENPESIFTVVVGSVSVESTNSSIGHYAVSPEELVKARMKIPEGLMPVGWYHSHPGHGVFLSKLDLNIMEKFYNLIWQTAYVFDTLAGDRGFFHGSKGDKIGHIYYLKNKPVIIEAMVRYNCALSASEDGDEKALKKFAAWLRENPSDELSHWVDSRMYQNINLDTAEFINSFDGNWKREFDKAVSYYESGNYSSAQHLFERLAKSKADVKVLSYLKKIKSMQRDTGW